MATRERDEMEEGDDRTRKLWEVQHRKQPETPDQRNEEEKGRKWAEEWEKSGNVGEKSERNGGWKQPGAEAAMGD